MEPSWGRVLATTVSLWVSRRWSRASVGWPHPAGRFRRPSRPLSRWSARGLRLAILAAALTVAAVTILQFTAASSTAARSSLRAHPARASQARTSDAAARAAASVRSQAAAWIASQVGRGEVIACDPLMCAELQAYGVAASRLLPVPSATDVIVAPPSLRNQLGSRLGDAYASALIASFGSGDNQIDVRAAYRGGAAAYNSALQADLAARQSAGAQLLRSRRIEISAQGAEQLLAGDVDTRLLIMLAALASMHPLRVIAFGDASPGAQVPLTEMPFRQVTITSAGTRDGAADLAAALAMLRAQRAPYLPAQVTLVPVPAGQAELRIEFAAPSPLGLLAGGVPG